jgi:purine-cytosine permease-like protein
VGALALGFGFEAATFLGVTMLGAWFALKLGGQTDPGAYLAGLLGLWGVLFVVITQMRINVTNTYSGSLAYANFFARVFHFAPGRHWWVVLTALLSTGLMFGGIYARLPQVLTFEAVFVMAWILAVVSDVLINKRILGLSPRDYPYKRSQTYNWNPVGIGSLILALVPAIPMAFGLFGPLGQTLAPFVSGALAFVAAPVLAYLTKGRYYVSPTVAENVDTDLPRFGAGAETEVITASTEAPTEPCVKCGKHFELAEFVRCPFHEGAICSVCCAAEPDCGELCKQQAPDEPTPVSIEDRRR